MGVSIYIICIFLEIPIKEHACACKHIKYNILWLL